MRVVNAVVRAALPSLDGSHMPQTLKSEDMISLNALAWQRFLDQGLAAHMAFQDDQWSEYVNDVTDEWTTEEYCTVYEQALNVYGHTPLSTLSTEEARWLRDPEAVGVPARYADVTRARYRTAGQERYHYRPKPPAVPDFHDGTCHITAVGDSGFNLYGDRKANGKRSVHSLTNSVWATGYQGELHCRGYPGAGLKELTSQIRQVLPGVQAKSQANARELCKKLDAERRKARAAVGCKLDDEDEAAFEARKAKVNASEAAKGLEPLGAAGAEDIVKPYVIGSEFVLVVVWNANELANPQGKGVLPAGFARTLCEFTQVPRFGHITRSSCRAPPPFGRATRSSDVSFGPPSLP